jgi:hypothetical protein
MANCVVALDYGLPFRCFTVPQVGAPVIQNDASVWVLPTALDFPSLIRRSRPAWLPLLGNSLLWATALTSVYGSLAIVRRVRRAHRGCCLGCGHIIAGLHRCPECGRAA